MLSELLIPKYIQNKIRLGSNQDGGYVLAYEYLKVNRLISCGCDDQTSFEQDFLSYNPSALIDIYDIKNICSLAKTNKNIVFHNQRVNSIQDLYLKNECIIQMDIEGSEFEIFKQYTGDFQNVVQLIVEFHLSWTGDESGWSDIFNKINKSFYLIHIHGNNCENSYKYDVVPDIIECTYLNKNYLEYIPQIETRSYPLLDLDYNNCLNNSSILMNWWLP